MKTWLTLLACGLALLGVPASAQTLPRTVMLGVGTKPLEVSAARAGGIPTTAGVVVTLVVPGSTAAGMGLQPGDVIASVNGVAFKTHEDVATFARTLKVGDALDMQVVVGGVQSSRKGVAVGRPLETSEVGEVRYDAVGYALGTLRTIVHIPRSGVARHPAIFYLQGYPCSAQEFLPGSKFAGKQAIDDWVKAGYVVFRMERPNLNDSQTTKDCRDTDFDEEVSASVAAYQKLLGYDFVDRRNVFLFGHSLGSVIAPILAQTYQPRGIMVYGAVVRSWFEYFVDIQRKQSRYFGDSVLEAERATRSLMPIYFEWLENGKSPQQLRENPAFQKILDAPDNPLEVSGDYFFGRHHRFWSTMNRRHLGEAWSQVTGKVLAIYGEFDVQAIDAGDAQTIVAAVNESHPGQGTFLLLRNTDHGFLNTQSYAASVQIAELRKQGRAQETDYNPEFGRATLAWLQSSIDQSRLH